MSVSNKVYAEAVEQQSKLAAQLAQAHDTSKKNRMIYTEPGDWIR